MNFYAPFTLFLPFIAATSLLLVWAARLLYYTAWKQARRVDALHALSDARAEESEP